MNLRCQHCGEQIVARGFGKCPGCYRELPPELQLSDAEQEIIKLDEEKPTKLDDVIGIGVPKKGGINPPF